MTTEHTPLPWSVHTNENGFPGLTIQSEFGMITRLPEEHDNENRANAELIARAVNNHAALLAALRFIVNDCPAPGEDAQLTVKGYNRACAAIAKAEGSIHRESNKAPECKKCGSPLKEGYCEDETCPYSSWPQFVPLETLFGNMAGVIECTYGIKRRQPSPLGPPSKGPNPVAYYNEGFNSPAKVEDNPYPSARWLPHKYWAMGAELRDALFPRIDSKP